MRVGREKWQFSASSHQMMHDRTKIANNSIISLLDTRIAVEYGYG